MPQDSGDSARQPLVLRHHAQDNTHGSQTVDGGSQAIVGPSTGSGSRQTIVQQHIKDSHCHRGDPLTQTQGDGKVFKARGA